MMIYAGAGSRIASPQSLSLEIGAARTEAFACGLRQDDNLHE
jgi:hypothetical protein